jgi:hypothetical protein
VLGDGHIYTSMCIRETVVWNGQPRNVEVNATDTVPLIGMTRIFGPSDPSFHFAGGFQFCRSVMGEEASSRTVLIRKRPSRVTSYCRPRPLSTPPP